MRFGSYAEEERRGVIVQGLRPDELVKLLVVGNTYDVSVSVNGHPLFREPLATARLVHGGIEFEAIERPVGEQIGERMTMPVAPGELIATGDHLVMGRDGLVRLADREEASRRAELARVRVAGR